MLCFRELSYDRVNLNKPNELFIKTESSIPVFMHKIFRQIP